jgi:hypothetical protein
MIWTIRSPGAGNGNPASEKARGCSRAEAIGRVDINWPSDEARTKLFKRARQLRAVIVVVVAGATVAQ